MSAPSAAWRVFGIGSPFGEDRVGWATARLLQAHFSLPGVCVEVLDRPGVELVGRMHGARAVWLLDAVRSGAVLGALHRLEAADLPVTGTALRSTHGFGVADALALAQAIGGMPNEVIVWGIEIGGIGRQRGAGRVLQRAIGRLAECVAQEIRRKSRAQ
ncbi:MAG: hydrogenase maturation protease [Betaproteobacteria bacterium]|nr:hydrogenase maturation protease [Betaproteobacteria bacterium]